jgi:hypothetical protein
MKNGKSKQTRLKNSHCSQYIRNCSDNYAVKWRVVKKWTLFSEASDDRRKMNCHWINEKAGDDTVNQLKLSTTAFPIRMD